MSEATSTIQFEACLPDFPNSPWLFKAFPIFFLELGSEYLMIFEKDAQGHAIWEWPKFLGKCRWAGLVGFLWLKNYMVSLMQSSR